MPQLVQYKSRILPDADSYIFVLTTGKWSICMRLMFGYAQPVMEVFIDDESKLTLHGLQQHFVKLAEDEKNRKLNDLLDALEFNQVGALNMLSSFVE